MRSPRRTGHSRKSVYAIKNGSTKPKPTKSFRQGGIPFVRGTRWARTPDCATCCCKDMLAPLILLPALLTERRHLLADRLTERRHAVSLSIWIRHFAVSLQGCIDAVTNMSLCLQSSPHVADV